jgi:heme-degrading monooxygenase HmoA
MLCLFFDVKPKPGHMDHYFEHVARLKPVLARHRGLLFLDRYRPLDDADALLSHQLWQDADAIAAWRADPEHKISQAAGRRVHFEDYRIRVGTEAAADRAMFAGRYVIAAYGAAPVALPEARSYESVTHAGAFLTLSATQDPSEAKARASDATGAAETVRVFAIDRDYTLTDRAEAPA